MNRFSSIILTLISLTLITTQCFSQDNYCNKKLAGDYLAKKGEVYFSFFVYDREQINSLSTVISIDNVADHEVFAYANKKEFENFLKLNIPYYVLHHPGDADFDVKMSDDPHSVLDWDTYPTYDAYVAMMNQFASSYPNLCTIVNAGSTVQGRQILFAKIKNNVNVAEGKPKVMFTSTMHGDETTGYVLMLRLINYLLTNYNIDPKVTSMMNNIGIWINPLANPDGTYHGGNGTVNGAVRYNANGYDLNRNFPGVDSSNSQTLQPETLDMMNMANQNYFSLSVNFHTGAEVVNYPWDSWPRFCTDDSWWIRASRQYADTVHHYAVSGYMTDLDNGITNGWAWYYVHGSRQDYMCYYMHGRECTIELSHTSLLPPAQLPAHWDYNYRSFLNYMQAVQFGITGTVTDSSTGSPVKSKISITGFDADSSEVYSDSQFGKYYRMIIQGNYALTFSAPGYYSKTVNNIHAVNDSTTIVNVQLRPNTTGISQNGTAPKEFKLHQNYPNPFNPKTIIGFQLPINNYVTLKIYDVLGREVATLVNETLKPGTYETEFDGSNYPSGVYYYRITAGDFTETKKMVLIK
jgi:hypothetical protein